jgi:hypothetical protein
MPAVQCSAVQWVWRPGPARIPTSNLAFLAQTLNTIVTDLQCVSQKVHFLNTSL